MASLSEKNNEALYIEAAKVTSLAKKNTKEIRRPNQSGHLITTPET